MVVLVPMTMPADRCGLLCAVLDRHGRTDVRIALRQIEATGCSSRSLPAWLEAFDRRDHDVSDEGDGFEQHGH